MGAPLLEGMFCFDGPKFWTRKLHIQIAHWNELAYSHDSIMSSHFQKYNLH